jgi:hypothetical protein
MDLLFVLCTWHAFAKLRLHTESTLGFLKESTKALGQALRYFAKKTCSAFRTQELPREGAARGRRQAAAMAKGKSQGKGKKREGPLPKIFNMCTYKLHALGDYVASIWLYGTTDNYSTQVVSFINFSKTRNILIFNTQGELEHRRVKRFYARTNKLKTFTSQITKHQRRERILRRIHQRSQDILNDPDVNPPSSIPTASSLSVASPSHSHMPETTKSPALAFEDEEALPLTSPADHHHLSNSRRYPENVIKWLTQNAGDPALSVRFSSRSSIKF